jgi:Fur family peroxide stress response transcriptional regulator
MNRRETRQREAILGLLRRTDAHPTADQIYDEVRIMIPNISKGTVYRNLKILQEMKEITELNLSGTVSRYEGKKERHYHFRCEKCGRVFDLDEPVNKELDEKVAHKTGFQVSYHQLEFRGLCRECQKNKAAGKGKHQ